MAATARLGDMIPTAFLERWCAHPGRSGLKVHTPVGASEGRHAAEFTWDPDSSRHIVRVALPCGTTAVAVCLHGESCHDLVNECENLLRDIGWELRGGSWYPRLTAEHRISMLEHIAESPLRHHAPGEEGSAERARFFSLAMCGEAGELANLYKKDWRGDAGDRRAKQIDELADVQVYVIRLAKHLGVCPLQIAYDKFEAVEQRPEVIQRMRAK